MYRNRTTIHTLSTLTLAALLSLLVMGVQPAFALTDFMYFSVNGDTSLSTLTQGDALEWAANCGVGSTVRWEIWYDANANSVIQPATDALLGIISITDGSLLSDADQATDGWVLSPELIMFLHPGSYIFHATDFADMTTSQRSITCNPMASPPNKITGTITVPGHAPPDSAVLGNVVIWAEIGAFGEEVYTGVTNENGVYEMNVGSSRTGLTFQVGASEVAGFSTPESQNPVVSGITSNVDFSYSIAADSVYGFLKDSGGSVIDIRGQVFADAQFPTSGEKEGMAEAGRYVINFSASELGSWDLALEEDQFSPIYLNPARLTFSHDTLNSFQHDFTLYRTDTVIFVRVLENGAPAANNYLLNATSGVLQGWSQTVSGTGINNITAIRVSSLDPSGWIILPETDSRDFPMPPGLIWDGIAPNGISPGDTVTLNFVAGHIVSGRILQDPGDPPVNWNNVWVSMFKSDTTNFGAGADFSGSFSFTADTGTYILSGNATGYLFDPALRVLQVSADTVIQTEGDTTGGFGFTINEAHCYVTGTLVNVPTDSIPSGFYVVLAYSNTDWGDGYINWSEVDSATGSFELDLCDGDWTIEAPGIIAGLDPPAPVQVTIGESPDCPGTINLVYESTGSCPVAITGDVNMSGGISSGDIIHLVNNVFKAGPESSPCRAAGDVDCSGAVSTADIIFLVNNVFKAGPAPCDVCTLIPSTWTCP